MNQSSQKENHDLVYRIRKGDRNAEAVLYNSFKEKLLYFVNRKLYQYIGALDIETGKDICQDAWIAVLENLRHGSVENPNKLSVYIYQVFSNKVVDAVKKLSEEKRVDLSEDQIIYPPTMGQQELTQRQREMFTKVWELLKIKERKILYLKFIEGWSHRRIAQLIGTSEDSCRKALQRAKERVLKKFG